MEMCQNTHTSREYTSRVKLAQETADEGDEEN